MAELAKEAGKLLALDGRPPHLARRRRAEHRLTRVAAGRKTGAIGRLVDRRALIRRQPDRQVLGAETLFAAVAHGETRRRKGG